MEDIKQAIIRYDWNDEKKGRAINRLTPETVAKLSGLPPGVMKAALEDDLASGEAANVAEAPCCHCHQVLKASHSACASGKQTLGHSIFISI